MSTAPLPTSNRIVRCPTCGSDRLQLRTAPDRIDRLQQTPVDRVKRLVTDMQLYHCRVCRLQFYDAALPAQPPVQQPAPVSAPPAPQREVFARESTLIGTTITIRGSVTSGEDIILHGEIEGGVTMTAHHLTVAPAGRVYGDVAAATVELLGTVEGGVDARARVFLSSSARLSGSIRTPALTIQDGAFCQGRVVTE